jgi:hypothetical protein
MRMKDNYLLKKKKKNLQIITFIVVGVISFSWGLLKYFFSAPNVFVSSSGRQPYQIIVSDGSSLIFMGLALIIGGLIKKKNSNKKVKENRKQKIN